MGKLRLNGISPSMRKETLARGRITPRQGHAHRMGSHIGWSGLAHRDIVHKSLQTVSHPCRCSMATLVSILPSFPGGSPRVFTCARDRHHLAIQRR